MNNYKIILALDPSGSFHEGNGTTGWCLFDVIANCVIETNSIHATNFKNMEDYWHEHIRLIEKYKELYGTKMIVVIEDYLLYANKAQEQTNSRMETPKLIGILQHFCWLCDLDYYMQTASEVKTRWTNDILAHSGYIVVKNRGHAMPNKPDVLINRHCLDSIRHAVHYKTFKNKEKRKR